MNRFSPNAFRARDRYLGWLPDPKRGPSCSERCVNWGVNVVDADSGSDSCLVKLLAMKQPPLAFDATVPRYLAALTDLGKATAEAHRYYDQKDYKEDGCKKGQELHARMVPLFAALERADGEIRTVVERELPALWARRLNLVEKEDPRGQLARSLALLIDARKLFDLISDREAGRGGDGADAALKTQLQRFGETIDKTSSGPEGTPLKHPKWLYRIDAGVNTEAVELQKIAKEYARGELHARLAQWQRLPAMIRSHQTPPDILSTVRGRYNLFLRQLRGAGLDQLIVDRDKCL